MGYAYYLERYHHYLNLGFRESKADREAYEDMEVMQMQQAKHNRDAEEYDDYMRQEQRNND